MLLVCAGQALAGSNDWFVRAWRSDEGLPDNNVTGLVQIPDGYMWVATLGGLVRFDGTRFQEFSPDNLKGIPGRGVRAMVMDPRHRLWLALDRGIVVCVESNTARIFTKQDGLPPVTPLSMAADGDGGIWILNTRRNLIRIQDGKVDLFGTDQGLPAGSISCSLANDRDGRLWFSMDNKIGIFQAGRFDVLATLPQHRIAIGKCRAGGIWICADSQLLKCDQGGQVEVKGRLPASVAPGVVFEDRSGAVWIGTAENGLFRYEASGFQTVSTSHREILSLLEDDEGNLWVGTGGGGLDRLQRRIVEVLGAGTGQPFESVRSVCTDAGGESWLTTQNGDLVRQQGTNWSVMNDGTNWPGGRAMCVTADPQSGAVWVGTAGRGLLRWQNGRFRYWGHGRGLAGGFVHSLLLGSNGDLWIAMSEELQRLRAGSLETYEMPRPFRSMRAMTEDNQGRIWLGTSDGLLFCVKDNQVVDETKRVQGQRLSIRCLRATADGSLWIGYAGFGLGWFKDGKYARLTTEQGLYDDFVSQICDDASGELWFAGNHGIFRLGMREALDAAAGRIRRVQSVVYGRDQGIPNLEATYENAPGIWRAPDGRLLLATRSGLVNIHPENVPVNPRPPPVRLERLTVDDKTVGLNESRSPLRKAAGENLLDLDRPETELRLPPNHHRIEFDFTALSFTAPENVQFRYRLEGLDDQWSPAGTERSAHYSRLPAGRYCFRVTACNNAGVWSPAGASLSFVVLPFVWQTWWFRLAILGGFTVCVIGVVRYISFRRLRWRLRVLEQQAALDKERTRIARDLHDDLGGSLTETALLLEMTERRPALPETAREPLRQCSELVRRVVKSVDEIIWAINPRNDTLRYVVDYISQFATEFLHAANLRCRVDLPDQLPDKHISPEVRHNLFLVVKEALNNVARHAHAGEVWLRVAATGEKISFAVEDDGRGFFRAPDDAFADGLRNMRQRMEEIGGSFNVESRAGTGTRVMFVYPFPHDPFDSPARSRETKKHSP
jgi:signal transduction histidine kinase